MAESDQRKYWRNVSKPETSTAWNRDIDMRRCEACDRLFLLGIPGYEDLRTDGDEDFGHQATCRAVYQWIVLDADPSITRDDDDPGGGGGAVTWARADIAFDTPGITFATLTF